MYLSKKLVKDIKRLHSQICKQNFLMRKMFEELRTKCGFCKQLYLYFKHPIKEHCTLDYSGSFKICTSTQRGKYESTYKAYVEEKNKNKGIIFYKNVNVLFCEMIKCPLLKEKC